MFTIYMKSLRKNKKYKKQKTLKLRTLYGGQDTPIESENTKTFVTAQEEEPPVVTAQEGKEEPPVVTEEGKEEQKEEQPVVTEEGTEEQPVTEEGKEEQPIVTEEGTEQQPVTEEGIGEGIEEQPVTEDGKDEEADDDKYIIQTDTGEQPQEEVSEELKEDYMFAQKAFNKCTTLLIVLVVVALYHVSFAPTSMTVK